MPIDETFDNSIPWRVIAASPDMMDVTFNNRRFPYAWRSSLAISVYEPPTTDLTPNLCGQRISFVKVTCSLTGYQTMGGETETITFGNEPLEELERLTSEYLGCYGALLNVAVFPSSGPARVFGQTPDLSVYPHILDFSPKARELVRSITEGGELLTGSTRNVGIDQSQTTTTKNETSVGVEAGVEAGIGGGGDGAEAGAKVEAKGKISHTWGTTEEDKKGLNIESGDSQTSKQTHSTSLDQLYSLLTGYHSGTNRATFIMLSRPGTLQATNRRTFAPGLRMLEGVQDFILVVARPEEQEDLCIEASLKTGHFPEAVELVGGGETVERRTFPFRIQARAKGGSEGLFSTQGETIDFGTPERPEDTFIIPGDGGGQWIIDVDAPEGGIIRTEDRTRTSPSTPGSVANEYNIHVIRVDDRTVQARGRVIAHGGHDFSSGPDTVVDVTFNIHVRRPQASPVGPTANQAQMLVTKRGLSTCYRTVDGCPQVVDPSEVPDFDPTPLDPGIERFDDIQVQPVRGSAFYDSVHSVIRSGLISSAATDFLGGSKRAFADTDYFSLKVARSIPKTIAEEPVVDVTNLQACNALAKLLGTTTVQQLLSANLRQYVRGLDLKEDEALKLRRTILQYVESRLKGKVKGK